ncbi:sensor histidine kinase [Aliiroseovarius lamellibrachiae]|uniref:sensor histidine kinase n=1 Tax=Aliiroseovarius lamellibrachiae TaxID=1924933 RepID=UPI001BDF9818|nr:ATP-binding protein [Aliiroseovarius lamellibrachiae]MBT2130741.1 sensor histidine kinase [Aliiroseovarius lamellibrachiae]
MLRLFRFRWFLLYLLIAVPISGGVGMLAWRDALDPLAERAETDLALASDRLQRHLFRYRELVVVAAEHPVLRAALYTVNDRLGERSDAVSFLSRLTDMTGARQFALVDVEGHILARSEQNVALPAPWTPDALPVVRALNGALGQVATTRPGTRGETKRLFSFAAPLRAPDGRVIGAVVAEIDIRKYEDDWPGSAAVVFFSDAKGRVLVTNRSELVLADRMADDFMAIQQHMWRGHQLWSLDGGPYLPTQALHLERDLLTVGLKGELLLDSRPALRAGVQIAVITGAIFLLFGGAFFVVGQRRRALADRLEIEAAANTKLEARVVKRTAALTQANADLQQAQADLVQAGKLSALGQMSAGISHELNQPLMAIRSFADNGTQFLSRGAPDKAGANLLRISELAGRMDRIIKNLRAFARNESEPHGKVDLAQVINAAVELTGARLRGDDITLGWHPPDHPVYAIGGEVRLGQVFVNLINNAADAMAGQDKKRIDINLIQAEKLTVTVRDTGPGITNTDKIFDPFYTTKQVGEEGMGLGLSISYGLVQSFGGNIRGTNAPTDAPTDGPTEAPSGAMFTVELEYWSASTHKEPAT